MVRLALILSLSLFVHTDQGIDLPPVPAALPVAVRSTLGDARAALVTVLETFNKKAERFSERCAKVVAGSSDAVLCERDYQALMGESARLEAEKKAFATRVAAAVAAVPVLTCSALNAQLARDNLAMSRLTSIQKLNLAELQGATDKALEAQKDAVIAGGNLLLAGAAKQLAARSNAAKTYKGWVTQFAAEARQKGVNVDALLAKADSALSSYGRAAAEAEAGSVAVQGLTAKKQFTRLWGTAQSSYALQLQADGDLRSAVNDLTAHALAADVGRNIMDLLSTASDFGDLTGLKKAAGPAYSLLAFASDYSYNGFKWWKALVEIENQSQTLGDEMQAMRVLQDQITFTTDRLKTCSPK